MLFTNGCCPQWADASAFDFDGSHRQTCSFDRNAKRDDALVRGSYPLGCRGSEIAAIRWQNIEVLSDGAQIPLLGKGSKGRVVRVSGHTLELFESLSRGEAEAYVLPSPCREGYLIRQAIGQICRKE